MFKDVFQAKMGQYNCYLTATYCQPMFKCSLEKKSGVFFHNPMIKTRVGFLEFKDCNGSMCFSNGLSLIELETFVDKIKFGIYFSELKDFQNLIKNLNDASLNFLINQLSKNKFNLTLPVIRQAAARCPDMTLVELDLANRTNMYCNYSTFVLDETCGKNGLFNLIMDSLSPDPSSSPMNLLINQPFVYYLRDVTTNSFLFLGMFQ
jgi:hypothetical protein